MARRFGFFLVVSGVLALLAATLTGCSAAAGSSPGGSTGGNPVAHTTMTGALPTATGQPAAYVPGSITFSGQVQRVSSGSLTVSMPDGNALAMRVIAGQTDLSHCGNALPRMGQQVTVHVTATQDGNFTAHDVGFADPHDQHDWSQVEYHGVTTSAVGADRVLRFGVGTRRFNFPISPTADLGDFNHHAQSIGANQTVDVHVQFQGTSGTAAEVDVDHGSGDGDA